MDETIIRILTEVSPTVLLLIITFFVVRGYNVARQGDSAATLGVVKLASQIADGLAALEGATMAAARASQAAADALKVHDQQAQIIREIVERTEAALIPLSETAAGLTTGQEKILAELANISVDLASIASSVKACVEAETSLRDDVMREIAALESRIVKVLNDLAGGVAPLG